MTARLELSVDTERTHDMVKLFGLVKSKSICSMYFDMLHYSTWRASIAEQQSRHLMNAKKTPSVNK